MNDHTCIKKFDWSAPRFLALEISAEDGLVCLSAGGQKLVFKGSFISLDSDYPLEACWDIKNMDFAVVSLKLGAKRDTFLKEVSWFDGTWVNADEQVVNSTSIQDNFLFLRKSDVSFFISLDFPCSSIKEGRISYKPYDRIPEGGTYICHSLSIGACRLSGVAAGNYDRAEIEAASAYVEKRFPTRFNRPVTSSACITNRMTYAREGRVFYSMYDNPTLYLDPDTIKKEVELCSALGVEYYQLFEGLFDWPDQERTSGTLMEVVSLAEQKGVRIGDYVTPGWLYCAHYNYEHRCLDKPEWRSTDPDGQLGQFCYACREYMDYMSGILVEHNRKHREEFICMDSLVLHPCYNTSHNHAEGDVYRQVRGLTGLMESLSALSPDYLVWSNAGNWLDFMPKLVWYNPNVYLTDPHPRKYSPGMNMLKYLGDCRREQMVTVHDEYFVPYTYFTNCEYYHSRHNRVNDIHVFEYSLLQGLAVTPNLCLAELRTFLERIPAGSYDYCKGFIKKWISFMKEHFEVWRHTMQVGDAPGMGSAEIYSHIADDRGYICLVNQNVFLRTARFCLDGTLGLSKAGEYDILEIYPSECLIAEQSIPFNPYGSEIVCDIPPESVRILEVRPYVPAAELKVYGLPAKVTRTDCGYSIEAAAQQGEKKRLGLVFPAGESLDGISAMQAPTVPMYTFAAAAETLLKSGGKALVEIAFPRDKAPRELSSWRIMPQNIGVTLPMPGRYPFLGALVRNAFSEEYRVLLDVKVKPADSAGETTNIYCAESTNKGGMDASMNEKNDFTYENGAFPNGFIGGEHIFETEFELPFIEWNGLSMGYGDDEIIELAFTDPGLVKEIGAAINGTDLVVLRYAYPNNPSMFTYYIELTGAVEPGLQHLTVRIVWKDCPVQ